MTNLGTGFGKNEIELTIIIFFLISYLTLNVVSIKPYVRVSRNKLFARTAFLWRLLNLFSYCSVMEVDKDKQEVVICKTRLWVFKKIKKIPFDRIKKVNYTFDSLFAFLTAGRSWFFNRTAQDESFTVGLELINPEDKIALFNFFGENCMFFNISGDQASASKKFVDLLMEYTGKRL